MTWKLTPAEVRKFAFSPTRRKNKSSCGQSLSAAEFARFNAAVPQSLTSHRLLDSERPAFAAQTSIWDWFQQCQSGRWGKVGKKSTKAIATTYGYRDSIRCWCEASRPSNLDETIEWPGWSLETFERLTSDQWQPLLDWMDETADLAAGSIKKHWRALRVFLNHAKKANAIRWYSDPELPAEDDLNRTYSPKEVAALWRALKPWPLLRSAFVCSLNCGLRTNDLLCLPWSAVQTDVMGRRILCFRARKTGKQQTIPLAPITVAALEAARRVTGKTPWIFWGLTNPAVKFPERSKFALERREIVRSVIRSCDLRELPKPNRPGLPPHISKPWQVGRATCATRYETYHLGVGAFVLAHSKVGVTARSYTEPTELVWEAVLNVPQYDCFRELL